MSTPAALLIKAELDTLTENAGLMGWSLEQIDDLTFVLALSAKDGVIYHLRVRCDGYPATPPAWHWFNPAAGRIDDRLDTPRGGSFLHGKSSAPLGIVSLMPQSILGGRIQIGRSAPGRIMRTRGPAAP